MAITINQLEAIRRQKKYREMFPMDATLFQDTIAATTATSAQEELAQTVLTHMLELGAMDEPGRCLMDWLVSRDDLQTASAETLIGEWEAAD